jgi:hypothetical protein
LNITVPNVVLPRRDVFDPKFVQLCLNRDEPE